MSHRRPAPDLTMLLLYQVQDNIAKREVHTTRTTRQPQFDTGLDNYMDQRVAERKFLYFGM